MRTFTQDTVKQAGDEVTVKGWVNSRRDHGGLIFIDLRDHTGIVQLAVHPEAAEAFKSADSCRDEFVLEAQGQVVERTAETVNPNLLTGKIELKVSRIAVLNSSKALPFQIAHSEDEK